jgi:hypothetical protein
LSEITTLGAISTRFGASRTDSVPVFRIFPQSRTGTFATLHIHAALAAHTDGTLTAEKKEAHLMPSRRWLSKAIIPVLAAAALFPSAAIAKADPRDDGYLAQLRGVGFTWDPEHDGALIGQAYLICDDLGWGWTPDHIAQQVHANLDQDSVQYGQVAAMVNIARAIYCPTQRCWAPHC